MIIMTGFQAKTVGLPTVMIFMIGFQAKAVGSHSNDIHDWLSGQDSWAPTVMMFMIGFQAKAVVELLDTLLEMAYQQTV